jgi:hypothetical protein
MKRLAAAAVLVLGFASGCGSTQTKTVVQMQTVTTTVTVTQPAKANVKTVTSTVTTTAPQPSTSSSATPGSSGGHSYNGDGQQQVGTITVVQDSTLRWTCGGSCTLFSIDNDPTDGNSINLSSYSGAHSGETNISAGDYHKVQVITNGTWTFTISPG